MATFNQQGQSVGYQVNGETVIVNGHPSDLTATIDDLILRARDNVYDQEATAPVINCLRRAREASANGNSGRALSLLHEAAGIATPIAAIATSIGAVIQSLQ